MGGVTALPSTNPHGVCSGAKTFVVSARAGWVRQHDTTPCTVA